MLAYRLMQSFLQLVVSIFFRNIEIVGRENIPEEGGILFAGNHPNSLMDPLIVVTQSGRVVHFAAKDVLFQSRFLRIFLTALGAVPIRRRMDHGGGSVNNQQAFDALFKILAEGRCMGIFPEGISHISSELSRLKTGTARIALGVKEAHPERILSIVPVGLTFLHQQRVRSRALIHFGEPILVDENWCQRAQEDFKGTCRELTDELETRLRTLTINTPDWETMRLMHTARRLYRPNHIHLSLSEYAELTRRFVKGYLAHLEQPTIQKLHSKLIDYQDRLDALQIRDQDLRKDHPLGGIFTRLLGRLFYLVVLLPLAIPGTLLHAPVILSAVIAGDRLTARKDVVATTKLVTSVLTVPLLYATVTFLFGWWMGSWWAAGLLFFLLPLTGFATLRVLEQKMEIGRSLRAITRLLRFQSEVKELQDLRKQLVEELDQAVDAFHDPNQARMIEKEVTATT